MRMAAILQESMSLCLAVAGKCWQSHVTCEARCLQIANACGPHPLPLCASEKTQPSPSIRIGAAGGSDHRTERRRSARASGHGPRRPRGVATVDGLRLPQLQLRDDRLPLLGRPLRRGLRPRSLRRPRPPLPLPPPAGATQGPGPQARRLGTLHAPHAHVLVQGRRHDAALGPAARLGTRDAHHRRRILRLLRRPTGGALTRRDGPSLRSSPCPPTSHIWILDEHYCTLQHVKKLMNVLRGTTGAGRSL